MASTILDKSYDPHQVEEKWYRFWMERNYFRADEDSKSPGYSIVIPPPNVTGVLHIGHALNNTLQDILIRFKRMDGFSVLWMPGTDHAGIATQNVVERQLMEEGLDRHALGRDKFIERVWKWKEQSGGTIINQLKKLGASCDWSRERFTMDKGLSEAVREVFIRLYQEGLIYRSHYIINWCPRCQTALSDLEVEHHEISGRLYHLRYPFKEGDRFVIVATTRPETMMGDTAVAVHPEDDRYHGDVGKQIILPVIGREIPVVGDPYVDREFGTGCLKITPAHDFNDFEIGLKHGLEQVKVIDEEGRMSKYAGPYHGMDRFDCRERIVEDFKREGILLKTEDYHHKVGHCYRCKTIVEPNLSLQWFVRTKPLAQTAIQAVRTGQTRIVPELWEKTYYEWMENIKDWCISRQIWWGHRIPAWYCEACGEVIVAKKEPHSCSKCRSNQLRQETDVLDTWFSSALWPFSTMGWPGKTPELKVFYPTSVLVTGFDILFFWVARMMMMGLKFMGDVPFKDVYIHGLVRDEKGEKYSKTRGNVVDPLELIERFGADALRFTLAALTMPGSDLKLSESRTEGYRHFANKIWNASRFALMNLEALIPDETAGKRPPEELNLPDQWIRRRLNETIRSVRKALDEYKFNEACHVLYQFIWHEFCDWYLEMAKLYLYRERDSKRQDSTRRTLVEVLDAILRLLHPFMPFITEEIWQRLPVQKENESIMVSEFPKPDPRYDDQRVEDEMAWVIEVVNGLRNIRGEMNLPPSEQISVHLRTKSDEAVKRLRGQDDFIQFLASVKELNIGQNIEKPLYSAYAVVRDVEIFVPMDRARMEEEAKRLQKEILKIEKESAFVMKKLSNEQFLSKAPPEVVQEVREKAGEFLSQREKLEGSLVKIREMLD
ncbi:MAG: valine--tRNA ligase [Deltaproteobacteria bacterium]|nr:valine--tRNA ligase [Deltaproteobacteria bacterium]MBM4322689.1 valine--tRNA ligase [Deltaproteobacteria bacterium]